jgi:hypothetical protein
MFHKERSGSLLKQHNSAKEATIKNRDLHKNGPVTAILYFCLGYV